jgi:hypothetical protein
MLRDFRAGPPRRRTGEFSFEMWVWGNYRLHTALGRLPYRGYAKTCRMSGVHDRGIADKALCAAVLCLGPQLARLHVVSNRNAQDQHSGGKNLCGVRGGHGVLQLDDVARVRVLSLRERRQNVCESAPAHAGGEKQSPRRIEESDGSMIKNTAHAQC